MLKLWQQIYEARQSNSKKANPKIDQLIVPNSFLKRHKLLRKDFLESKQRGLDCSPRGSRNRRACASFLESVESRLVHKVLRAGKASDEHSKFSLS